MSRIRLPPLPRAAAAGTAFLAVSTIAVAAVAPTESGGTPVLADALLAAQFALLTAVLALARGRWTGTRRTVFTALAVACAWATIGHAVWTARELLTGHAPSPPYVEAATSIAFELSAMAGFVTALGRFRHRNWMRFEAMVDALILVAAAAIIMVQFSAVPTLSGTALLARRLVLAWNVLATANLILILLLLVWRGEVLGTHLASWLSAGAAASGLGDFLYGRRVLLEGGPLPPAVAILWSLAVLAAVVMVQGRNGATEESVESPLYASDAARVRAVSIVVAILIATFSAAVLSVRGERSIPLGIALAAFGILLALRAGHALWSHRRTTLVLEHAALAERELSATLEHRVAERTGELAEAHRVMQRMWTLGQQIALELTPERVLQRFMEAAVDVLRVDGGAVALATADRMQVAITTGIGAPLAGRNEPIGATAMGRVVRTAHAWCVSDAAAAPPPDVDVAAAAEARGVAVIPLQRRGECLGAVMLLSRAPRTFTESELSHVEAMGDLLSVALANADLLETLRKAEWRFRTLFRVAPDAVLTVYESGRIVEANDAVRDILGLFPAQVVGRTLEDFVVGEDRGRMREEFARVLGGRPSRVEVRLRGEGGVRIVALAARRLPETDPPMVLLLGRDMTADLEMRARLAETERLAAVGELVAGVAHEVNNPLCTISAFGQLLQRDAGLSSEQRESVDVICSETLRASQVLRDLLTFARRSESESGTIQINDLIERTLRLRSYEMTTQNIAVQLSLAPQLPLVQGDARQIQQVILNLVMNALQAMESGGTLSVSTSAVDDRVVVEVSDTGPGIPAEARIHVFEPFFTTKRDGTGLGLSVSYGIVAAHGGAISIARTGPDGTSFRVSLPALDRCEPEQEDAAPPVATRSPLSGIRMLFVDDELALHRGIRSFARRRGFSVVTAGDGAAALDAARREPFDVVVCDLRMSGIDGPALYEVLRREYPSLAEHTLFITGDLVSASSRAFLESVSQPVLAKPFDLEHLETSVASLLRAGPVPARA